MGPDPAEANSRHARPAHAKVRGSRFGDAVSPLPRVSLIGSPAGDRKGRGAADPRSRKDGFPKPGGTKSKLGGMKSKPSRNEIQAGWNEINVFRNEI